MCAAEQLIGIAPDGHLAPQLGGMRIEIADDAGLVDDIHGDWTQIKQRAVALFAFGQ